MNESLSTKDAKKLNKASVLSHSKDPKDWDSARARQVDVDYKDLVRQLKAKKKKKIKESFEIDKDAHNKAKKKAKLRNLARGNENPAEKKAAEKKAGGPKLYGEGKTWDSWKKAAANALKKKKEERKAQPATDAGARARRKLKDKEHNKYVNFLHADDD